MQINKLLIKGAELNGNLTDIYIEGNRIARIGTGLDAGEAKVLDGRKKGIIPGLVNGHTHAAMTLFRGFADDMRLRPWLEQKIWPNEAKMTHDDIYWGVKLACLEMIKSGTTTFLDMYQRPDITAEVVEQMGMRGYVSAVCVDNFSAEKTEACKEACRRFFARSDGYSQRVKFALGPHAVYTVSGALLQWVHQFASEQDCLIHLHLSETEEEVRDSIRDFGFSPVRYLYKLGVLSPRLVVAHAVFVDKDEMRMLADHGVKVVHNPASNMKLASGYKFPFVEMKRLGIPVGIGTDGCSSSNNLDMIEAMKLASLLGKVWRKDPELLGAQEVLDAATVIGADMLGLKAGRIEEGYLADLCLVDLEAPAFTPNFNFTSNLVYAANGSCVDTVICDGKILMENRKVPGEAEILEQAARQAYDLVKR